MRGYLQRVCRDELRKKPTTSAADVVVVLTPYIKQLRLVETGCRAAATDAQVKVWLEERLKEAETAIDDAAAYHVALANFTTDVDYSENSLFIACDIGIPALSPLQQSIDGWTLSWRRSLLESRVFDTSGSARRHIRKHPFFNAKKLTFEYLDGITNRDLVELMRVEAATTSGAARGSGAGGHGPLVGLMRNWFEVLDPSGTAPSLPDILDVYRGKFTPQFTRHFVMRDAIVEQRPEVLSILLNSVMHRYDTAGVRYTELSVSVSDLLSPLLRRCLTVFVHQKNDGDELINLADCAVVHRPSCRERVCKW